MPHIEWEELNEIKHVLQSARDKLVACTPTIYKNQHLIYMNGLIGIIDNLIDKYSNEEE